VQKASEETISTRTPQTPPMPETGAPWGEVSECLDEGKSERLPLRWAPFAGNEELWLRDSPAGCRGNV